MIGLKSSLPGDTHRELREERQRVVREAPAADAVQMSVRSAPADHFELGPTLAQMNALQHTVIDEQIQRAGNRGPRNPLAPQRERKVVGAEVPRKR